MLCGISERVVDGRPRSFSGELELHGKTVRSARTESLRGIRMRLFPRKAWPLDTLLPSWVGSPVSSLLGLCSGIVYTGMHGIAAGIAVAVEGAVGVSLEEMLKRSREPLRELLDELATRLIQTNLD